jgi:cell wall assembly regulator SMI1
MMCSVDTDELRQALGSHSALFLDSGMEVGQAEVSGPATHAAVDEVEGQLGVSIPPSLREALVTITSGVHWRWQSAGDDRFEDPFSDIFSGGLDWSLDGLVDQHHGYLGWVEACFSDPNDPYDAVWHRKLGLAHVPNGDVIAVDLDPETNGAIVYLSHDDGEGHGYVMANSLGDLLDRWVPLACPGPEDWQWLPFVPYDLGPIDPAGQNGTAWRQLTGLSAAPPRTPPSAPDNALFDELVRRYRNARDAAGQRLALRALRVCNTDRAQAVIGLLNGADMAVQEEAARLLGRWRWRAAVVDLKRVALTGTHNGRIQAMLALRAMPWDEATAAREELRVRLDATWRPYLD